jgi:alpha-glucosidase
MSISRSLSLFCSLVLAASLAIAQQPAPAPTQAANQNAPARDAEGHEWWQHAVFYEIYPRSFADSNNDGIGDLNGIASKMDYLQRLGVDAIWITPCFPSPQVDFGYDVSDYENIDPKYGTLADFDKLVAEGRKHGVSVILDFVVNHTSDKHPWFIDSASSRDNPKRDWYIWRDGKGPGQPPNNWNSTFGGPAWKFDPKTNQWYYHYFYAGQPDLNWRNPAVEKAMFDVPRFWFNRGVMGFRLDAVSTMYEDPNLKDNPVKPGKNKFGDPNQDVVYNDHLPEVHDALKRLRKVADEAGGRVLIGETWTPDIESLKAFYGANHDELQMPMDFLFTKVDKLSPPAFRKEIAMAEAAGGWPVYLFSNHDIVRQVVRYGDKQHDDQIAKLLATMLFTLRGTPILYYGEEIGMVNNDPKRKQDVQDPIGRTGWPQEIGRDGERTPMQWNTSTNAGFSTAKPWLPVPASYKTHNVEVEEKDPNSILRYYQKLTALRKSNPALHEGDYTALNENDANVLAYLRKYKDSAAVVAINMTNSPQTIALDLASKGVQSTTGKVLASSGAPVESVTFNKLTIPAFTAYVIEAAK